MNTTPALEDDPHYLPPDPRQTPHPLDPEWSDPDWRERWLNGLTDEQLASMSAADKGQTLPAYIWNNGYEIYGIKAIDYQYGINALHACGFAHEQHHFPVISLGRYIRERIADAAQ